MSTIQVEKRDPAKKAKQLRRLGFVPCVIYGNMFEQSAAAQIDQSTARQLLRNSREGSKVELRYEGQDIPALIKSLERSTTGSELIHISFHALNEDKKVRGCAQIVLTNREKLTGVVEQTLFEVKYSALPADLFDQVSIDLSDLGIGSSLTVADIPALCSDRIELQTAKDVQILKITDKKHASTAKGE